MSLQSALAAAGGFVPLPRALHIALQICDAAGEAHSKGVVHRDLKPENVMLIRRGEDSDYIKVLDFGIARLNWGEQSMATAAGLIFGTARYISPEGAQGDSVGPASDVYAIATLLYQMLAGRTPFEGEQAVALLIQQIHDPPPRLQSIPRASGVPDPIAAVIMTNLAKSAADRMPEARVLGRMLVDAAKASGLSPEDLVPRSMLLGSKQGPMQLPPIERTKQLDLTPEVAARLGILEPPLDRLGSREATRPTGAVPEPPLPSAVVTSPEAGPTSQAPAPAVVSARPVPAGASADRIPASAATTKWAPPPELQARLAAVGAPGKSEPPAPRKPFESNVDRTMDDDDSAQHSGAAAPIPPTLRDPPAPTGGFPEPKAAPAPGGTVLPKANALASPAKGGPSISPSRVAAAPQAVARASLPEGRVPQGGGPRAVARTEFSEPVFVGPKTSSDPERVSAESAPGVRPEPPSLLESTLGDDDREVSPRRMRSRAAAVIFLCFTVGVILAATVLFKLGFLGGPQPNTLDTQVARADEALRHKRWDAPAGDNVRDLTDDGLAQWPKDPRLVDIRERAADELVKEAVGRKFGGDLASALHLAKVANELDPTDTTAQHLVEDYQLEEKPPPTDTRVLAPDASVAPSHAPTAKPGSIATPTAKVTIDALPARPHVGQPVGFVAKVTSAAGGAPKSLEDVHFRLNGPGLSPDTRLSAILDVPGTYRAAFTFFQAGKYDITFEARVDGVLVRAVRQVAAGEDALPDASPATPPPAPSGKWL
jgi:serine/threonine-protein kinase